VSGRRRALVVAVDAYEHPGLRRLPSAAADAQALAGVLGDPAVGGFDVEVVRNEAAYEIQARIEDLFAEARADDVLLLHFSGHGLKNDRGELFFAARTTRPDRLASSAVPADFVQRCLAATPSRSVVLLLDCCYGGAFGQGVVVRSAGDVNVLDSFPTGRGGGGRGRAVISASNAMEYAFEGEQLLPEGEPRPSPFTAALVHGLATGEADHDEDGFVSLDELYDYVFDRVRAENPKQTPTRDIEMQGELYLARSARRRIRPAPLPGDLQAALADANPYTRLGAVAELRSRLLSESAEVAAGARAALEHVVATDTRLVAEAARDALGPATEPPQTGPQPSVPQPSVPQPTVPQPTVPQPTEPQPTERPPTGPQPTDPGGRPPGRHPVLGGLTVVTGVALAVLVVIVALTLGEAVRLLAVVHPAVLVAGGLLVLRGTALPAGLGLVAAAGAAATVMAVVLVAGLDAGRFDTGALPVALPALLLGVLLLAVLTGVLAAVAAGRSGARLSAAQLSRPPALVAVAAGVVGSAALGKGAAAFLANTDSDWSWLVPPSWWYAVPALLVPLLGAAAAPVLLRRGVLVGWVVGAAGVYAAFFPTIAAANSTFSYLGLITFAATLPFVLVGVLTPAPDRARTG
jgi:hypothetical protein